MLLCHGWNLTKLDAWHTKPQYGLVQNISFSYYFIFSLLHSAGIWWVNDRAHQNHKHCQDQNGAFQKSLVWLTEQTHCTRWRWGKSAYSLINALLLHTLCFTRCFHHKLWLCSPWAFIRPLLLLVVPQTTVTVFSSTQNVSLHVDFGFRFLLPPE